MNPSTQSPSLPQLWRIMLAAAAMFSAALMAAALILSPLPIEPAWSDYTLIVIGIAILPSILSVRSFRDLLSQAGRLSREERTRRLQTRLLVGVALADLPALAAFVHTYVAGEFWPLPAACAVTIVIVYLHRPDETRAM